MKRPELLIPAGNPEKLNTAILYGADAVYVGVAGLSLRSAAAEFSLEELESGVTKAHHHGVKVYAALNTFARNQDLPVVAETVSRLEKMRVDAVIISDPGVLQIVRQNAPGLPIHLSTQANTTNSAAVKFWQAQGVKRIVLARELNLGEIAEISRTVPKMELELFVHGAMCVAYSGRCLLSAFRNGRSSNRGDCTQPCRWEYRITESTRTDDPIVIEADQRYTYLLNSKDLCMIRYLPEVLQSGIASLKVEGRMKSVYYVAAVTRVYREALNLWLQNSDTYRFRPEWEEELRKVSHRGYTTGFYFANEMIAEITSERKYYQTHDLVGTVLEYQPENHRILVGVRNHLDAEDEVDLLLPDETIRLDPHTMTDMDGRPITVAHNSYKVYFPMKREIPRGAVLRSKNR